MMCVQDPEQESSLCWELPGATANYDQNSPCFQKAPRAEGRCVPGVKLSKVQMWPAAGIYQNEA